MSWIDSTRSTFDEVFSLRDNLFRDYQSFVEVFARESLLDERLMQLCQQRCEQLHRSGHRVAGLDTELQEALPQWYNSLLFSPLEKAALQLAECFCLDPHSISDAMTDAVIAHSSDAELVALLEYLAVCDGFARFRVLLVTEQAA